VGIVVAYRFQISPREEKEQSFQCVTTAERADVGSRGVEERGSPEPHLAQVPAVALTD
jgi:hypothetical protein